MLALLQVTKHGDTAKNHTHDKQLTDLGITNYVYKKNVMIILSRWCKTYPENCPDLESVRDPPGGVGPNGSNLAPGGTAPLWQI